MQVFKACYLFEGAHACNAGLFQLFGFVVNGDRASADATVSDVSADCEAAERSLGSYRALYG